MTDLAARFDAALARLALPPGRALIAVSGGPDSVALLHLLARSPAAAGLSLAVVHVDHGISPDSGRVADLVGAHGAALGLPVRVERLALGVSASETRAREARYAAFRRALRSENAAFLFLAHHADDQVETILMRFLRGSGPAGLAGMPVRRGRVVRPLLPFGRDELAALVAGLGIPTWDDPANRDPRHDRAWIRHELLPRLEARWPGLRAAQLKACRAHAQNRRAWSDLLPVLAGLAYRREPEGASVAAVSLRGYSFPLQVAMLGALARRAGIDLPARHVERVQRLVAVGHSGRRVELGRGAIAELAFGRLRLVRLAPVPRPAPVSLEGRAGTARFGPWSLRWAPDVGPTAIARESTETWLPSIEGCRVRPWAPGDRIRPLGGRGSRPVVRCLQEQKVPRSARPNWPVLECAGSVVWVPGVCRSDSLVPAAGAPAVRIDARRD